VTEYVTHSEAETETVGEHVGATLVAGRVLLLNGPLGAGKTAFTRGVVRGLGGEADSVSSPTFTLVQEYDGRTPVVHVDLYRLADDEVDDLALEERLETAVVVVEWPERWKRAPADAWRVTIEPVGDESRRIRVESAD
jgi:tRNA threonylcarbamoyladenosine biosynthesis protein TsaE